MALTAEQQAMQSWRARCASMAYIHPEAIEAFMLLKGDLERDHRYGKVPVLFAPFETYRHPQRQIDALANKTSRAGAYQSAHQFGLAIDFVPNINGKWSWDLKHPWDYLRERAHARKLLNELTWDRAHVEHPKWADLWACYRTL